MIIDRIENLAQYASINPRFAEAITYLLAHNFIHEEIGKTVLESNELIVNVTQTHPKTKEEAKLETHENFIDIQIPLSDTEIMGYTPIAICPEAVAPYDPEKDITFYKGLAKNYLTIEPGMFAIFFPSDAHAPGITPIGVKKVIIKVKA